MELLQKIEHLMEVRGLNQGELEAVAALPKGRVSRWMMGTGKPTAEQAFRIARALRVRVDYLLDDSIDEWVPDMSDIESRILEIARVVGYETAIRRLTVAPEVRPIDPRAGDPPPAAGGKPRGGRMRGA